MACTTTLHRSKSELRRTGQYLHLQTTDAIIDITGYVWWATAFQKREKAFQDSESELLTNGSHNDS